VAAEPDERPLAQRHVARETHDDVEAAGGDGEHQRGDVHVLVVEVVRDQRIDQHVHRGDAERDPAEPDRARRLRRGRVAHAATASSRSFVPSRPCGRTRSTAKTMAYGTAVAHAGEMYAAVISSGMPKIPPPSTAPPMLPRPPSTTIASSRAIHW